MAVDIKNKQQFARLWNANTATELMAEIFDCHKSRIYHYAKTHDLRPRDPKGKVIEIPKGKFQELWQSDYSIADIAAQLRCRADTVDRLAEYFALGPRPERKGTGSDQGKLTNISGAAFWTPERDKQVRAAAGRYQAVAELAAELGVATTKVIARWHRLRVAA